MVSEKQYKEAMQQREDAEKTINKYYSQEQEAFEDRLKTNPIFTDDELTYSARTRCPCGAGVAYPKTCGMHHYWDCSAILKGTADRDIKHTHKLPFIFYNIKSESASRGTTRSS